MPETHAERVAAAVRAEMARRRVTQTQVANALGLSQQAMSRRLVGNVPLTVGELLTVAECLDIDPATLLDLRAAS